MAHLLLLNGPNLNLLGIRQIAVLVNKLDLVDYSQQKFEAIEHEYRAWLKTAALDGASQAMIASVPDPREWTAISWHRCYAGSATSRCSRSHARSSSATRRRSGKRLA